ncbi:ImmA/IrrE family metallo-endopeptidase [Clostridium niameyense]|uniref:ImmA/IrrE family metallo-endopeptidase n=1 Tax=Clostridium niameyense TaxID=1622073 RepID=UPI00067EDA5A|nr:ImmA/IrrE family metallo-endopeptidase [Clostridium niameyense]
MRIYKIINLAQYLKKKYDKDPIKICDKLGIQINYINLKPNIYPAYTIKIGKSPVINLNNYLTSKSQKILCAHELGHALLHGDKLINEFNDTNNGIYEYEANLFAVALLFNQKDLCIDISTIDNYILKGLLDYNIKTVTNESLAIPTL